MRDHHAFQTGHIVEKAGCLEIPHQTDGGTSVWTQPGNVLSIKYDFSSGRLNEACNQIEQSGLAGTVGADYSQYHSFFHSEIQAIDCHQTAEALG